MFLVMQRETLTAKSSSATKQKSIPPAGTKRKGGETNTGQSSDNLFCKSKSMSKMSYETCICKQENVGREWAYLREVNVGVITGLLIFLIF